jgi:hypothetical protein
MRNARPRRLGDGVIDGLASDERHERRSFDGSIEHGRRSPREERGDGDGVSLAEEENNGERGACMHA